MMLIVSGFLFVKLFDYRPEQVSAGFTLIYKTVFFGMTFSAMPTHVLLSQSQGVIAYFGDLQRYTIYFSSSGQTRV